MATLYEAVTFAYKAYQPTYTIPEGWEVKTHFRDEWLWKDAATKLGYCGIALVNEVKKEVVIAHRGTKLYSNRINESVASIGNWLSDSHIASRRAPRETQIALNFTQEVMKQYPSDMKFTHVGHSLGGFHAHICGYYCKHNVIAFDPPGCLEILCEEFTVALDREQLEKHVTFLLKINLINHFNEQVGKVFIHADEAKLLIEHTYWSLTKAVFHSHQLMNFVQHIPESAGDPLVTVPESFIALDEYKEARKRQQPGGSTDIRCTIL